VDDERPLDKGKKLDNFWDECSQKKRKLECQRMEKHITLQPKGGWLAGAARPGGN